MEEKKTIEELRQQIENLEEENISMKINLQRNVIWSSSITIITKLAKITQGC